MKLKYTIAALAVTTMAANAATVASYVSGVAPTAGTTGAADPTTQGWTYNGGLTGFSHGLDSTNGGWRITDGTSGQPAFYQASIAASNATHMSIGGDWTAAWTTAVNADAVQNTGVPNGVDNYYASPNNGRQNDNAMWIEVSGSFRYILTHRVDTNNDIQLTDGTNTFQITTANNQLSQELGASVANYVTYTLTSVGGVVSLTDSLGNNHGAVATLGAASQNRVVWGATSSGGQGSTTWNSLSLQTIPEPSSAALLGLGGLALMLRRRK